MKSPRYQFPLLLSLLAPAISFAAGGIEIHSTVEEEQIRVNERGERTFNYLPAGEVTPGDTVRYTLQVNNSGGEAADSVAITNPVPPHMVLKDGTASGIDTRITFSVDGGKSYDSPDKLRVINRDGNKRPAHAEDYSHLRWQFTRPLQAGETATVYFKAVLQ